jgi:hypothetical protein
VGCGPRLYGRDDNPNILLRLASSARALPQAVPFRQSAFYTGLQGARGQDAALVEQQNGHIVFRTTRPLPAGNGPIKCSCPKLDCS